MEDDMEQKRDDIEQVMHEMETKEAALKSEVPQSEIAGQLILFEGEVAAAMPPELLVGINVMMLQPRHVCWWCPLGADHLYH